MGSLKRCDVDRLEDLLFFAEIVDHDGFSAAARNLGLQRSKLSRRIAELEQRMGVRLLQRNTRHISLTSAGEQVYSHARILAQEARAAFNIASELYGEPRGVLRVACSSTLAANALISVVSRFCRQYPHVRIVINAADQIVDLVSERADLAFRVSSTPLDDSSLITRVITPVPMVMAMSADLLRMRQGKLLLHPSEVPELGLIALAAHDGIKKIDFSQSGKNRYRLRHLPRLMCGNMSVLLSAVGAGLGVAALPRYLCLTAIAHGQLVDAFDPQSEWQPDASQLYSLMPTRRGVSFTTRLFLDFATPLLEKIVSAQHSHSLVLPLPA